MRIIHFLPILFAFSSCNNFQLKDGDLLFQDIDCGPMCDAIEAVTDGINSANFSHIGLVIIQSDSVFVLEAISKGVVLTPINEFLGRSFDEKNNPKVIVGRLKTSHRHLITSAISESIKLLGIPYDDEFTMNNNKYYCSELIFEVFKRANNNKPVFELQAMTFKYPDSEIFFPVWEKYFNELEISIPEGEPGLNPGGISKSNYLDIVYKYGIISGWQD